MCVCVCVCVCEGEREREGKVGIIMIKYIAWGVYFSRYFVTELLYRSSLSSLTEDMKWYSVIN